MITTAACLNMREALFRIRMAQAFQETSDHFAGPVAMAAQAAFLYGREYGKWEAGAIDRIDLPDADRLAADVRASPDLKQQLAELREIANEVTRRVANAVHEVTGMAHAADLLAQWEGFGRFCRGALGMEPLVLTRAFGLEREDLGAAVREAYPDAVVPEADANVRASLWLHSWTRRFGRAPLTESSPNPRGGPE